jgi:hypothetical protein
LRRERYRFVCTKGRAISVSVGTNLARANEKLGITGKKKKKKKVNKQSCCFSSTLFIRTLTRCSLICFFSHMSPFQLPPPLFQFGAAFMRSMMCLRACISTASLLLRKKVSRLLSRLALRESRSGERRAFSYVDIKTFKGHFRELILARINNIGFCAVKFTINSQ